MGSLRNAAHNQNDSVPKLLQIEVEFNVDDPNYALNQNQQLVEMPIVPLHEVPNQHLDNNSQHPQQINLVTPTSICKVTSRC